MALNFRKTYVEQIIRGEKTATRRTEKPRVRPNRAYRLKIGFKYLPDRILVRRVYAQRLGDMTSEDAGREGFATLEDFKKAWMDIYAFWADDALVWAVEFEYLGRADNFGDSTD